MRLNPSDRALIVNALHEKAAGDRQAAADLEGAYVAATLADQADQAERIAQAIEAGEPMLFTS